MAKKSPDYTVETNETETVISAPEMTKKTYKRMEIAPREFCYCGEHMARYEKDEDWVCIRLLTGLGMTEYCQAIPKELVLDAEGLEKYTTEKLQKRAMKNNGITRELNVNPIVLERMKEAKDAAAKAGPKKRKFVEA